MTRLERRPFPHWLEPLDEEIGAGWSRATMVNRAQGHEVSVLLAPGGRRVAVVTSYSRHARNGQQERRRARLAAKRARRVNR